MADIVPFGKYKGQPVSTLLADQDYLRWVLGQPGLVQMLQQRHPTVFNIITIGAPQSDDTPEHNRLQARFLDRAFQEAIFEAVSGKRLDDIAADQAASDNVAALQVLAEALAATTKALEDKRAHLKSWENEQQSPSAEQYEQHRRLYRLQGLSGQELETRLKQWTDQNVQRHMRDGAYLKDVINKLTEEHAIRSSYRHQAIPVIAPEIYVSFEHGFDVMMTVSLTRSHYKQKLDYYYGSCWTLTWPPEIEQEQRSFFEPIQVEIKPQIGDDFPAVLRQIRNNGANVVLIGQFEARGATLEQVRKIFGERRLVLVSEIEELMQ